MELCYGYKSFYIQLRYKYYKNEKTYKLTVSDIVDYEVKFEIFNKKNFTGYHNYVYDINKFYKNTYSYHISNKIFKTYSAFRYKHLQYYLPYKYIAYNKNNFLLEETDGKYYHNVYAEKSDISICVKYDKQIIEFYKNKENMFYSLPYTEEDFINEKKINEKLDDYLDLTIHMKYRRNEGIIFYNIININDSSIIKNSISFVI